MSEQFYLDTRLPIRRTRWRSNPARQSDTTKQLSVLQRFLAEIDREITEFDESIIAEEATTRVSDLKDVKYSLAARHLRTRRGNLASTKTALLSRIAIISVERQ